jgi:sugar lactone lactonase YvrE
MKTLARYALGIGAAAAMLAGCASAEPPVGGPGVVPRDTAPLAGSFQQGLQHMAVQADAALPSGAVQDQVAGPDVYKVSGPLLYVVDWIKSKVQIYNAIAQNPSPIATIHRGVSEPYGACIDASGTLYLANSLGWVSEYHLGHARAFTRITKGVGEPDACAIDANGNLWLANLSGHIEKYKKGATSPSEVISHDVTDPIGIAIDHSGNIYVSNGVTKHPADVEVYAPGSDWPTRTITDGVTSPTGITVDAKGTLYVTNVDQNNVEEYLAGQSQPYQAITQSMDDPDAVTVNKKGRLYVGNFGNGVIVEFAPGSLTPLEDQIHRRLRTPQGLVYYPPLLP